MATARQANLRKAGRYKLAAPVPKTGLAHTRGRSITDAVALVKAGFMLPSRRATAQPANSKTQNERKSHETHCSLSKPVALSQELQTSSHHANPADRKGEYRFPPGAPVWIEAGTY
jgi:hypothetical protein